MARATLGGAVLLDGPVAWQMRAGVAHTEAEFEMSPKDAQRLTSGALSPVTLKIDSPGAKGVVISFLYVIQMRPSGNPHTRMVKVVDRRWFWNRVHVNHYFNMRRAVGVKRVKGPADVPELDPVEPDIQYAPYSIRNETPWTAKQALEKIWETVQEPEKEATGSAPSLSISSDIASMTDKLLPLEDIELADDGQAAMRRILNFIPGSQITVDDDGTVRVYSIASGEEKQIMDAMMPEQEGGGHAMPVSYARQRPSEVRIFFAPEVEMKFEFHEAGAGATGTAVGKGTPFMTNVLPVPDYSLSLPGGSFPQGTWLPFTDALKAWSKDGIKVDTNTLRFGMAPGMDLWNGLNIAGLGKAKAAWGPRIAAMQTHYRRTFQLNDRVVRSCRSIRAYRTATINPTTGTRAAAVAYQDWAAVATQRFLAIQIAAGGTSFKYAENFENYPDGGEIKKDSVAAPIEVKVLDADQGIIQLDLKADPYRTREQFVPSKIDRIPTGNIKLGGLLTWNSIEGGKQPPALSLKHDVLVILTLVPGSPNSKDRLFRMTRKPSDVSGILPSTLSAGLTDAKGPPIDVFVGPGWEVARIAWNETKANQIKDAFGFGFKKFGKVSDLAEQVVNLGSQDATGNTAASMDAIANAVAASVYAGYSDRVEGSRTTPVTHAARVSGFVESVMHQVAPTGEATSTVTVMGQKSPLDVMSLLPVSTRAIILKLATSAKAVQ